MITRGARLASLESRIADRFDRRHCLLVGSGTAALYCVFRSLRPTRSGRRVLYPDTTCETAVNASIFAGCVPSFADTDPADGNMTAILLEPLAADDVLAVVPTHIFGHLLHMDRIRGLVDATVPFVEDAAQAYGGSLDGSKAGAMGDASILSFGAGKLVDVGGGGAILTDDSSLAESCRREASALPANEDAGQDDRRAVMRNMMEVRRAWRDHRDRTKLLRDQRRVLKAHRNAYLWRVDDARVAAIEERFEELDRETSRRAAIASTLDEILGGVEGVHVPERTGQAALWRYTFLVDSAIRDSLQAQLRRAGVHATKLFSPCSDKFAVDTVEESRSHVFASRVLNLELPLPGAETEFLTSVRAVVTPGL